MPSWYHAFCDARELTTGGVRGAACLSVSVGVRVVGFEPDVLQIRHIGHAKLASPAPSPRWGGVAKAKCGVPEPWNGHHGTDFDPRQPKVLQCASRRSRCTRSPHGATALPVPLTGYPTTGSPHCAAAQRVRLTASGLHPYHSSPVLDPPHGAKDAPVPLTRSPPHVFTRRDGALQNRFPLTGRPIGSPCA